MCIVDWITIELHIALCNNGSECGRSHADVTGDQWPVLLIELSHCNLQSVGDATHCITIASLDLVTRVREVFLCPDCLGPSFF